MGEFEEFHVDQRIDRRNAERIVRIGAVARDAGAGRPHAHIDALLLVEHRHDGKRHRRIDAAEDRRDIFGRKFARRDQSLRRARLVVALHQFEHAPAKEAAFGVDLLDRKRQPAGDRLARLRRRAGQSRHLPDLDRIRGKGPRSEQDNRSAGNQRARRALIMPQQACSHQRSP